MLSTSLAKRAFFAGLIVAGLLGATTARAELPADALQRLGAAYAALDKLVQATRARGRMPRLSNPDEKPVLEAMRDPSLLGTPPYSAKDTQVLLKLMQLETAVGKTYLFFTPDPARQPATSQNTATYQDEIFRAQAFETRVSAAGVLALEDFVAHLPADQLTETRRAGLRQMRLGLTQMVTDFTMDIRAPVAARNKAIMARALADTGPALAQAATPADRKALAAQVEAAGAGADSAVEADLDTFVKAMSTTECKGLCAIQ